MSQADVNSDGVVNVLDILRMINRYICGSGFDCPELECPDYVHTDINPGCSQTPDKTFGYMTTVVIGDDLHIYHHEAFYQCCLEYYVDYLVGPDKIEARECDLGELCDCYCDFNLESVLENLTNGEYEVILIGIEGDTVGVDTITVDAPPELIDYGNSGCLEGPKSEIIYTYAGGILTLNHNGELFNCSAEYYGITVLFALVGDTLRFQERNESEIIVPCLCEYNITATVGPLEPGTYVAEIYHQETECPVYLTDRRVLVLE